MEPLPSILRHYEQAACAKQWLEFNRALGVELSAGLAPEDLRQLFFRIGQRLALSLPVARCETFSALQAGLNDRWDAIQWGFGTLNEAADCVLITHACSPLASAFGPEAGDWGTGFFEGAYQTWFEAQGMPSTLRVRAEPRGTQTQDLPQIGLRLAKVPS
jgi:hypothetical protein